MQRLRSTFTRSRTPTGAEMKTQNSLEVPKQVRSASFDEMQLESQRGGSASSLRHQGSSEEHSGSLLQVPQQHQQQRSRSFDSASATTGSDDSGTFLEVPGTSGASLAAGGSNTNNSTGAYKRTFSIGRRSSASSKNPPSCWHCYYMEEYERLVSVEQRFFIDHHELKSLSYSDSSSYSSDSEDEGVHNVRNEHEARGCETHRQSPHYGNTLLPPSPCNITFTLSPTNGDGPIFPTEILSSPPVSPLFFSPEPMPSTSFGAQHLRFPEEPPYQYPNQLLLTSPIIEIPTPYNELFCGGGTGVCSGGPGVCGGVTFETCGAAFGAGGSSGGGGSSGCTTPSSEHRPRRRSISRQEAIFVEPTGNSLENVSCEEHPRCQHEPQPSTSVQYLAGDEVEGAGAACYYTQPTITPANLSDGVDSVRDIYLTVPDLKRDRAASVDSCFSKVSSAGKTEELHPTEGCFLSVPTINATRSRSVDIVLPTDEQARYKALALTGSAGIYGRSSTGIVKRQIRIVPDWSENAINGDHLWITTSSSGDLCCVPDECRKSGQRMKCSACQLIAHLNCIPVVNEKPQLMCKPTFRDVGVRQYREQTQTHHHWTHRRTEKSKCKNCGKAMQSKLFSSKEVVALACAWCKAAYHNKETCFNPERIGEECNLGAHASVIVPPSWIVKLPNKGNFKSSLRKSKKGTGSTKKKPKDKDQKAFIVKPIPSGNVTPVIVFINPKSGGNQGVKLMGKFQWLLNPRQVFDLTQGGPKMGLELFRKAPQLRILACGGDGTAGWVLSVLDQIKIQPQPAVGVLPLGTGNDLARALGWGGGYTDEPISKILTNIGKSDTVLLDRWSLNVIPNPAAEPTDDGKDSLPLNVVNNYFSFGVDAHIALEFHEAREAHPEKFNSRIRNKMFYGTAGGKDLLQRKWRDLTDFVTLECDGQDLTAKLKEARVHAILFLNIPSYGGGTRPWNNSSGSAIPSTDDGLIEVVGLTTYQLPMLQAGAHGTCICQCRQAKIVTSKTIPMQVDGEAARLKPSIIEISLLNKALLLAKKKRGRGSVQTSGVDFLSLNILRITMPDYEQHHYDKEMLKQTAILLGTIDVDPVADLEQVRNAINAYLEESTNYPKLSQEWCFTDSCTAERFFRIDRAQEHLHYITDISSDEVYVLDHECATMPQTPDQERSFAAFQQRQERNERRGTTDNNSSVGGAANDGASGSNRGRLQQQNSTNNTGLNPDRIVVTGDFKFKSNLLEKTSDAVLLAAKTGDLLMIRALHEQGFSLLSIDSNGQTALHYGSRFNHKDIIKYLISCAPRSIINMVDNIKGQTALHIAAENKRRDISVMLVAAGSSLSIRDRDGYTPMMIAFNVNAHDLAAYLESQERFLRMDVQEKI